jgi:hypothetical protein
VREECGATTYIRLDVLVLEVERMLPNVDANDGNALC